MTLVGWMVYQDSIEKFEKPEHIPDQIFMGIYNIMFCRAGNIVNNVQILGGNSQLGSTPIQFTPSDYVLYFFFISADQIKVHTLFTALLDVVML